MLHVRIRGRLLRATIAATLWLLVCAAGASAATAIVTLGFDDGLDTAYTSRGILAAHGVHGTYFLNSAKIGTPGYMTWDEVGELAAGGNEIGGHTLDHAKLTLLTQPEMEHQVCDDRTAIASHGFDVRNFAYPFGAWNATAKTVVQGCGYDTARTTGGTDWPEGPIFAETIPPLHAYTVRAIEPRLDTPLDVYQDIVDQARNSGGGWVDVVLHDVCEGDCAGYDEFSINADTLAAVLDWLGGLPDVEVRTTAQALDTTPPAIALTAPGDAATVTGTVALAAEASDDVEVDHVDFLVDGEVVGSDTTAPYSFEWDSSTAGDSATIAARAADGSDHEVTSDPIAVTVEHPDLTPPVVALTAPEQDATVTDTVTLSADASDDDSGVDRVDFVVDGDVVGSDDEAPYSFEWDSRDAGGSAAIAASAVDVAGNAAATAVRTVAVSHPVPAPPADPDPPVIVTPDPPPPLVPFPPLAPPKHRAHAHRPRARTAVDRRAPSVRIVDVDRHGDRLVVRVTAHDAHAIRLVRVSIDGVVVRRDAKAPYAISWPARRGPHRIGAVALDTAGNVGRAAPLRVGLN